MFKNILKFFFSTISLNLFILEVLLKFLNKSMKNMFKYFLKFLKHSWKIYVIFFNNLKKEDLWKNMFESSQKFKEYSWKNV